MNLINILFVCDEARHRSRTASRFVNKLFNKYFKSDYAGINDNADKKLTGKILDSASIVFVMKEYQAEHIRKMFGYTGKIINLNIGDVGKGEKTIELFLKKSIMKWCADYIEERTIIGRVAKTFRNVLSDYIHNA